MDRRRYHAHQNDQNRTEVLWSIVYTSYIAVGDLWPPRVTHKVGSSHWAGDFAVVWCRSMDGKHAVMLERLLTAQWTQTTTIKTIRAVQVHLECVHHSNLQQSHHQWLKCIRCAKKINHQVFFGSGTNRISPLFIIFFCCFLFLLGRPSSKKARELDRNGMKLVRIVLVARWRSGKISDSDSEVAGSSPSRTDVE